VGRAQLRVAVIVLGTALFTGLGGVPAGIAALPTVPDVPTLVADDGSGGPSDAYPAVLVPGTIDSTAGDQAPSHRTGPADRRYRPGCA
jgi:hypothetical protein